MPKEKPIVNNEAGIAPKSLPEIVAEEVEAEVLPQIDILETIQISITPTKKLT